MFNKGEVLEAKRTAEACWRHSYISLSNIMFLVNNVTFLG